MTMPIQQRLQDELRVLSPELLEITNESDNHAGPKGRESHFRVRVVSERFQGLNRVKRHRRIHELVADLLQTPGGIHALALELYTPQEWAQRKGQGVASPPCAGVRVP